MPETYTQFTWSDGSGGGTPLTASNLNAMTAGIESMDDRVTALEDGGSIVSSNRQTGTSYTLVLADAGKVVETNNASANTVTVPPNSSVAFPTGTVLEVAQYGAGQTTLVQGSGVTIRTASTLLLRVRYSSVALRKLATDEWWLTGDTA